MATNMSISNLDDSTWPQDKVQLVSAALSLEGGSGFRTATLVLAALNFTAALILVANIFFDAWCMRVRDATTRLAKSFGFLRKIHDAEIFPLVISLCIVLQSSVFFAIGLTNSSSIRFVGCARIVQLVFPAIWITFFAQLVFGLETAFRSLRRLKFAVRSRWHLPCCIVAIIAFTFFAWAATNLFPTNGKCLTGLIWWTARYYKLGIVISVGLIVIFVALVVIITVQLVKFMDIERDERIAATRVVYYLVVNTWILIFVLPYYIQIANGVPAVQSSQLAQVALNLTGITNLIMHLFLRSNADRLAIRALAEPSPEKRRFRLFGPNELNIRDHISYPVLCQAADHDFERDVEKDKAPTPAISRTPSEAESIKKYISQLDVKTLSPPPPSYTRSTTMASPARPVTQHTPSYSIFPNRRSSPIKLPDIAVDSPDQQKCKDLPLPPTPLFAESNTRAVSAQSTTSATVQIGLRLSYLGHALDPLEHSPPDNLKMGFRGASSAPSHKSLAPSTVTSIEQFPIQPPQAAIVSPQRISMVRPRSMRAQQVFVRPPQKKLDTAVNSRQDNISEPSSAVSPMSMPKPPFPLIGKPPAPHTPRQHAVVPIPSTEITKTSDSNTPLPAKSPITPGRKAIPEWRPPVWKPRDSRMPVPTIRSSSVPPTRGKTLPFNSYPAASSKDV